METAFLLRCSVGDDDLLLLLVLAGFPLEAKRRDRVQRRRKDLRVIVSSATLDAEEFFHYFNTNESGNADEDTAAIISLEGKMYPVGACRGRRAT